MGMHKHFFAISLEVLFLEVIGKKILKFAYSFVLWENFYSRNLNIGDVERDFMWLG